jgi:SNF2-related domain
MEECKNKEILKRIKNAESSQFTISNQGGEHPFFSLFKVKSDSFLTYSVEIHSLLPTGYNFCTCMDYKYNNLGTCKHIKNVLLHLKKDSTQAFEWTIKKQPELINSLYVQWIDGQPKVKLNLDKTIKKTPIIDELFKDCILKDNSSTFTNEWNKFLAFAVKNKIQINYSFEITLKNWISEKILRDSVKARLDSGVNLNLLKKPIKKYQLESAKHLLANSISIISEEPGTGKRISALAAASIIKKVDKSAKITIVTNRYYFSHWKRLIKIFDPHSIKIYGENVTRKESNPCMNSTFALSSYETLQRDTQLIQEVEPTILIFDELQQINKWNGKNGKLIKSLKAPFTFILSSINPVQKPQFLINLAQYVNQNKFGPFWKYIDSSTEKGKYGEIQKFENLEKIEEIIKPVSLSRSLDDLGNSIPNKSRIRVILYQSCKQHKVMNNILTKLVALAGTRYNWTHKEVKDLREQVRQIRLGLGESSFLVGADSETPKQKFLKTLLDDFKILKKKILIATHWPQLIESITKVIESAGFKTKIIENEKDSDDWANEEFDCVGILLDKNLGFKVKNARVFINYDLPWDKQLLKQRRETPVLIKEENLIEYNFVVSGSIEERGLVVLDTLPNLIGEWFDEGVTSDDLDEPKKMRNLIRKLAGRREDRITSSQLIKVDKEFVRDRKVVSRSRSVQDISRPSLFRSKKERPISSITISPKSSSKNIELWNPVFDLPEFENENFLMDIKFSEAEEAFITVVNPKTGKFYGFSPEYIEILKTHIVKTNCIIGFSNFSIFSTRMEQIFPSIIDKLNIIDINKYAIESTEDSKILFKDILESTLGRKVPYDTNEINRLHNNKRYNDLIELGQSDIKMIWEFLAYILKEERFFCRINNEKEFFKIQIKEYLPEKLLALLTTRTTL